MGFKVKEWALHQRRNDVYGNAEPRGWTIGIKWVDDLNREWIYNEHIVFKKEGLFKYRENQQRLKDSIERLEKSFELWVKSEDILKGHSKRMIGLWQN